MKLLPKHFPSEYARPCRVADVAKYLECEDSSRVAYFVWRADKTSEWVVFLHGNGEDHEVFGPMIDHCLERGKNVLALDARGQGKSTMGKTRLSYELFAQDAIHAMDELGIKKAHVVGFSDGAIEALILGFSQADRVLSILSIGANITPDGLTQEDELWVANTIADVEAWIAFISDPNNQKTRSPELFSPTLAEAQVFLRLMQLMRDEPHISLNSLSNIRAKVAVLVGEFDAIEATHTQKIYEAIPHATLQVVPNAEHNLIKHNVDEVLSAIDELIF